MKIPSSDRQAQRATCLGRPPQLLGPLSPLAVGLTLLLSGAAQADTFTYDALNRMTQAVTPSASETYVYGEGEGRIKKVNGTLTTYYIDADYEENWNGSTKTEVIKHYFAGAQRVATRDNEGLKYQHLDHLGSASRASDAAGSQVRAFWYDPYGSQAAPSGSATVKYQYTDKEHDQTNLYYYGARYYDPALGRFLSADSLLPSLYDPQQLNRYSYARNNPVKLVDPNGHQSTYPALPYNYVNGLGGQVYNDVGESVGPSGKTPAESRIDTVQEALDAAMTWGALVPAGIAMKGDEGLMWAAGAVGSFVGGGMAAGYYENPEQDEKA